MICHSQASILLLLAPPIRGVLHSDTLQLRRSFVLTLLLSVISQEWRKEEECNILAKWDWIESNTSKSSNSLFKCTQWVKLSLSPKHENPRRGEELNILLQQRAIFTSHKLSPHTRFDLARMPSQGGGSSPRRFSPNLRVLPSSSKWMKPPGCGVDADAAYRDRSMNFVALNIVFISWLHS